MPDLVVSRMAKVLRARKVFIDWSQNNGSKTTIAPYSLRGRDHPTVAAPRTWEELADPDLRHLLLHRGAGTARRGAGSHAGPGIRRQRRRRASRRASAADRRSDRPSDSDRTGAVDGHQAGQVPLDAVGGPHPGTGAGARIPPARQRQHLRHPGASRPPAALRLPARTRRRAGVLGGAQGHPAGHRAEPAGRADRGPPAGLRRFRRHHPARRVRRRHRDHLGRRHLRHREVARRRGDHRPERAEGARSVRADPHQGQLLAAAPDEGPGTPEVPWAKKYRAETEQREAPNAGSGAAAAARATNRSQTRCWPPPATAADISNDADWRFEGKWDGIRAMATFGPGRVEAAQPGRQRLHPLLPGTAGADANCWTVTAACWTARSSRWTTRAGPASPGCSSG